MLISNKVKCTRVDVMTTSSGLEYYCGIVTEGGGISYQHQFKTLHKALFTIADMAIFFGVEADVLKPRLSLTQEMIDEAYAEIKSDVEWAKDGRIMAEVVEYKNGVRKVIAEHVFDWESERTKFLETFTNPNLDPENLPELYYTAEVAGYVRKERLSDHAS